MPTYRVWSTSVDAFVDRQTECQNEQSHNSASLGAVIKGDCVQTRLYEAVF